jgi:hypothetical protein
MHVERPQARHDLAGGQARSLRQQHTDHPPSLAPAQTTPSRPRTVLRDCRLASRSGSDCASVAMRSRDAPA